MKNYKQYVIDFVEGRVKALDFIALCEENPAVLNWIQSIAPKGKICYKISLHRNENGLIIGAKEEIVPYDINIVWESWLRHGTKYDIGNQLNVHTGLSSLMLEVFPNDGINVDDTISELFDFFLDVRPNYIGGKDADELITKLMNELPINLSKSKRVKLLKEQIKMLFHIEKHKPNWLQSPEWPFSNGKPMRFVSQTKKFNGDLYGYVFEDIDTKEQKTIEQFS